MSVVFTPTEDTRQLAIRVDEEEYLLSDIAVDADHVEIDATDPQNPVMLADKVAGWDGKVSTISVNSGTPIAPTAGNVNIVIPESGHKIKANDGSTDMTQRSGLQFVNASVADDSTNNKTVVTIPIASGVTNGLTKKFYGTTAEVEAAIAAGTITEDTVVYISDDNSGSGDGGHVIINGAGVEMDQEAGLQFNTGFSVTDDSTNDKTVINLVPASNTVLGGVKVDNNTITIDNNGVISGANQLPLSVDNNGRLCITYETS